jgi:hypothetical protein
MLETAVIEFLSVMQGDTATQAADAVLLPPEQSLAFLAFVAAFTRWRAPVVEDSN